MNEINKEDKPMTNNTVKEILKQDYNIVKAIKERPESNYAQMYKEMLKNKDDESKKK